MVSRDSYGAIYAPRELLTTARDILSVAIGSGKLEREYCKFDHKKRGAALNYDLYDMKGSTVLFQQRLTTGDKYGLHPTKRYYLIRRCGKGVVIQEAPKTCARRFAANESKLGEAIDKLRAKMGASK